MLVESSFSSSVESSLLNASEYQDPLAAYDWVSLAETYQRIQKFPEQSQVSFLEVVPVSDAMNLDESEHPKLQVSCPEQSVMRKVSEKSLTSLVYRRRKKSVKPVGAGEHNPPQDVSLDDSIVPVQIESTKRKNCFNNCLVYSRKKRRGKSSCSFTGGTTIRGDGLDDASVSEHDCGETNRRGNRFHNCLVYRRKKGRVKFNSCSFSQHVSGETKISGDQADSSAYSQREQIVKADGAFTGLSPWEIKNSGINHNGETERNGDRSDGLLMYSRRKQRRKSIGVRVNGFLVYSRKKPKVKSGGTFTGHDPKEIKKMGDQLSIGVRVNGFLVYSRKKPKMKSGGTFTGHDPRETKKMGDQLSIVSSHALSVPEKYANSTSHVEQVCSALELTEDTQVTEGTCSSGGTNDSCSLSKSSSELAIGSNKTGEDEATDCDSSDTGVSETDGSSSRFRQCKHCDKLGTAEKMLICDKCEEAYHTRCCGVRMNEVPEIDAWLCPSCLKKKSSKTKNKGRISRERNWRVAEPCVIGIRIGKEFQADVPDWSGQTMSDTSFVGEPLEIDQSEYTHDLNKVKNRKKPRSAVNWLQCREEDTNGDICGKWRRAPRSEVQTRDWECFCCVSWDPSHADCAVPQELDTSEILKQLKYIKMLRPRSGAKRQKMGPKGRSRSHNKGNS